MDSPIFLKLHIKECKPRIYLKKVKKFTIIMVSRSTIGPHFAICAFN